MTKNIFYIIVISGIFFPGCKKYLDKEPDNRTQVETPEQIAQLLTTAYPKANYMMFTEAMSDNAEDKQGGGSGYDAQDQINSESYRFEEVEVAPENEDGPVFYWNACYKAIAAANQALEYIKNYKGNAEDLNPHRGEALLARAYAHFMLVTLFSKVYDPAAATSDPGIPYVTEPEKEILKQYERGTVAHVYEMIEKDITEGYPLIDDKIYGTAPRFHFNRRAAAAFASRFYLFKQDYQKVISFASDALGTSPADNLRPWNSTLAVLQYAELQAEYAKATTPGNLLLQETNSIWSRSYPSMRFGLGDHIANETLGRPNVTGGYYAMPLYGSNPQSYNIPKFYEYFVTETINANSGTPYNNITLLTGEEALLNRAEAHLRLGQTSAAISDLNVFASKNIDEYDPAEHSITGSKASSYYGVSASTALLLATLDFKKAFFLHEGLRWFDILRLRIPVVHETSAGEVIELGPDDNRRVLQLPVLTKQAGLEPNPR